MKVFYCLNSPIITPLTTEQLAEIEKLCTFSPITNISNDFDCGMDVTYYVNSLDSEFVADLNERVNTTQETVDELNTSLGLDIKLIDGVPHWSERGADSFSPFSDVAEVYYHFTAYSQTYTTDRDLYLIGKGQAESGNNTIVYIGDIEYLNPTFLYGYDGIQTIPKGTTVRTRTNNQYGYYNLNLIDKMPKVNTIYVKQTISF